MPFNTKVLLVGPSRCGKDHAGDFLKAHGYPYGGSTSVPLTKYVAKKLKQSETEAYAERHQHAMLWRVIGDEVRKDDPGILIKECLEFGNIIAGVRGLPEIKVAHKYVDLVVWIENPFVKPDPTLEFDKSYSDVIIENDKTSNYEVKLLRFFKTLS